MPASSPATRVEQALNSAKPFHAVLEVAQQLRDEGMSQPDLYALYDSFRAQHADDTDETRCGAVLDTMDYIGGWCIPSLALYPADRPAV